VLLILLKDLRQRAADSTLLVFAIVLPLGLAFLLGLTSAGGSSPASEYGVSGPSAAEFARRSGLTGLRPVADAGEARRLAAGGELDAVFVVSPAGIEVIGSKDAPIAVQVAREVAESYALPPAARPVEIVQDATLGTRELDARTYQAAGTAVFFLFFAMMFSVTGIFEERRRGTLARLLSMPVSRARILLAKLLGNVIVGLAGACVIVTVSTLVLGAYWGPPGAVAVLVLACVLASAGLMTLVASFARTAEQAVNWQGVLASLFGLLGGSFFPVAPEIGRFTPHHWFLQGLAELRGDGPVYEQLALPVLVLLGVAALTLPVVVARAGKLVTP
jgi:ABC-2 type transport system permease protein